MAPPAGGGGGGGGTPGKYVATWSADGKTLTIVTTRTTQNGERKSSEAWTLTDANTLTRTTTSNNNGTENKRVAVYQWNGFGFKGIVDSIVCESCRKLLTE